MKNSIDAHIAFSFKGEPYSYLYEVMLETENRFANAQGIAADFLSDGDFNQGAFIAAWQEHRVLAPLQPIATRELGIADLHQHQGLKNVLIQQACNLGKST